MESLLLFAIYTSAALAAPAPAYEQKPRQQLQHANHIFNSVHSSMRQWGSSLNHNGMSIFIAEVPEDIEFYHGTSSPYRINGTEWLAFEPEHALMFARAFHGPPPGKGRQPTGGPDDGEHEHGPSPEPAEPVEGQEALESQQEERKVDLRRHEKPEKHSSSVGQLVKEVFGIAVEQKPISSGDAEERHGYLHTYRTKHPLRLLYVDGQSAAKSDVGTLDVQDMVLLHREPPTGGITERMSQEGKTSVEAEMEHVESPRKHDDEPSRQGEGRRHYPIEGNNRNRDWLARFFRGDDRDLELLPPPPEFRDHHGPPPPPFPPHDEAGHERHHPPPPELARHDKDEPVFPPQWREPHRAHKDETEEHEHHGNVYDLLKTFIEGPPKHHRQPSSDEEAEWHHGSIMDWVRPHHNTDQHDSKYDGAPLFDRPAGRGHKRPNPHDRFDWPSDEDCGESSPKHAEPHDGPGDRLEARPTEHRRPKDRFQGPPSEYGRPDHHFHGPPPEQHNDAAPATSSGKDDERRPHGPMSEGVRAQRLCRLAREQWNGRIDGIIRMEAGFEIILCDFEKHLDVVQVAQSKENGERGGPGGPGGRDSGEGLNSLKAVAARYDGIGGARVKVDYDSFVSLYAYDDAVVFDDAARPRVNNDTNVLEPVFSAVKDLVVKKPAVNGPKKDWQAIADMLVSRYANRIEYLASGDIDTLDAFKAETDRALRPFIDYSNRNATREVARCAAQFPPSATSDKLAAEAIHTVSSIICRTLSKAGEVGQLSHGLSMIRGLKSWLSWTEWKKCRGCAVNEVCVVPMWPSGTAEDFEHPQCRSEMSGGPGRGDGYWGGVGPRP